MKILLLWCMLGCMPLVSFTQSILWVEQTRDVSPLEGVGLRQMVTDHNANVYVLYFLYGRTLLDGNLLQSNGTDDILLVKYNPQGDILWKQQIGGSDWDLGADLAIDDNDNILLTGILPNGGDLFGETLNIANGGAFVAKIHPAGTLIWYRQYGDLNGQGQAVTADHAGNVIVGGKNNLNNLIIRKYNSSGTVIWTSPITYLTCCVPPQIDDIQTDSDNNIVVAGSFVGRISLGGTILEAPHFYSSFITKISPAGSYDWFNQADAKTSDDYARSGMIAIDDNDNIYLTGHYRNKAVLDAIDLTENLAVNDRSGFVARLSPTTGAFVWAKSFYGRDCMTTKIKFDPYKKELNVVGGSLLGYQYDDQYISETIHNRSFIVVIDMDGTFKKAINFFKEGSDQYVSDIVFDQNDNIYVGGNHHDDLPLGCFTAEDGGWYTAFLYKSGALPDIRVDNIAQACVDTDILFRAEGEVSGATKFVWTFPAGFTSSTGSFETTSNEIIVRTSDAGTALISVLPYYACYPLVAYSTTLTLRDVPPKPDKPVGDTLFCPGTVNLFSIPTVETAVSYVWEYPNHLVPEAGPVPTTEIRLEATDLFLNGDISIKAINSCGESIASETLHVVRYAIPDVPIITGAAEFCAGESNVQFGATSDNAISYGWKFSSAVQIPTTAQDSATIRVTFPIGVQSLVIRAFAKGVCETIPSQPFSVTLIQSPLPPGDIAGPVLACDDNAVAYAIASVANGLDVAWSAPVGFDPVSENGIQASFYVSDEAVSGLVQVEVSNRCFSAISSLLVTTGQLPAKPILPIDPCETKLQYTGTDEFMWYHNGQPVDEILQAETLILPDSGLYKIQVMNGCGMTESDEIEAHPRNGQSAFITNVVTANSDGLNDYFIVDKLLGNPRLEIYNRWGRRVYESSAYKNNWDGQGLDTGYYYYFILDECGPSIKGWVHLIK